MKSWFHLIAVSFLGCALAGCAVPVGDAATEDGDEAVGKAEEALPVSSGPGDGYTCSPDDRICRCTGVDDCKVLMGANQCAGPIVCPTPTSTTCTCWWK